MSSPNAISICSRCTECHLYVYASLFEWLTCESWLKGHLLIIPNMIPVLLVYSENQVVCYDKTNDVAPLIISCC